ncbi:unnamed protein product [Protopolystoma xenopodis]|uniref:Uncharacterized protein n=1 Tax=Protopolystoma xenopodis TaxID=117903 RepID=A0A448WEF2_9PLAT|nr:unnamed protein product [Protopolystoma xenopodis]
MPLSRTDTFSGLRCCQVRDQSLRLGPRRPAHLILAARRSGNRTRRLPALPVCKAVPCRRPYIIAILYPLLDIIHAHTQTHTAFVLSSRPRLNRPRRDTEHTSPIIHMHTGTPNMCTFTLTIRKGRQTGHQQSRIIESVQSSHRPSGIYIIRTSRQGGCGLWYQRGHAPSPQTRLSFMSGCLVVPLFHFSIVRLSFCLVVPS